MSALLNERSKRQRHRLESEGADGPTRMAKSSSSVDSRSNLKSLVESVKRKSMVVGGERSVGKRRKL